MKAQLLAWAMLACLPAQAALKVVATTPDLKSLAETIGGKRVEAVSLCAGGSDPHYLEARPSHIVEVRRADLLMAIGAELEVGWLPLLQRKARNKSVQEGGKRFFEASDHVELLEIPEGGVDRSMGDVHAAGNPHFMNDPLRAAQVGLALAEKLAELDPGHAAMYRERAEDFQSNMKRKLEDWKIRVKKSGVQKIVGYHRELNYLMTRLGVTTADFLEPKPGIPPTARHLAQLVEKMKSEKISLLVLGHYYSTRAAEKVCGQVEPCRYIKVPAQVGGTREATSLEAMVEEIVRGLEGEH